MKDSKINTTTLQMVPEDIYNEIKKDFPQYTKETIVDYQLILDYRLKIIENQLDTKSNLLDEQDKKILNSIRNKQLITTNTTDEEILSIGQKAADSIAKFGGSWGFILSFLSILVIWIVLNVTALLFKPFDPYPFILLNLALSCLAAIQAPIILMSQNRQAEYDRKQANYDYEVNLKSEIEIRILHEKLDHIMGVDMRQLQDSHIVQIELLKQVQKELKNLQKSHK